MMYSSPYVFEIMWGGCRENLDDVNAWKQYSEPLEPLVKEYRWLLRYVELEEIL